MIIILIIRNLRKPSNRHLLIFPVAIETAGSWSLLATELMQEIRRGQQKKNLRVSEAVRGSARRGKCGLILALFSKIDPPFQLLT